MVRKLKIMMACALFACLTGPAFGQTDNEDSPPVWDEEQRTLTIDEVPAVVMSTARRTAPDVFFTSVESYWNNDVREYHLRGRLFREIWDLYIRDDGKLLRAKSDNQDS